MFDDRRQNFAGHENLNGFNAEIVVTTELCIPTISGMVC